MFKYHLPTIGVVTSLCLLVVAAIYYPGGTLDSTNTVGYSFSNNFICSLFAPYALNGAPSLSRYFAIPAMLLLCASLGVMFKLISNRVKSKVHKSAIEIGGIGAMVYTFFAVTPIHNLVITIGLVFGLVAMITTTHMLYTENRQLLVGWGVIGIALSLASAIMYYGNIFYSVGLPMAQKISLVTHVGWIVAVYYTQISQQKMDYIEQNSQTQPLNSY